MNFIRSAFIILLILLTVITAKIKPPVHQPMLIEDQDFVLTRISDTITPQNIPIAPVTNQEKVQETIVDIEQQKANELAIEEFNNYQEQPVTRYVDTPKATSKNVDVNVKTPDNNKVVANVNIPKDEKSQLELLNKLLNTPVDQIEIDIQEQPVKNNEGKVVEHKPVVNVNINDKPKPKPQEVKVETPQPKSSSNPYMTEQEEIIAWNVWRSNINNQIMVDSKIDFAPLGTIFSFTFVVDKFGNVSNINVTCSNPSFMDVARNSVKPAIANLQNKPILNFPRGTKRASTVVEGMFAIGTREKYYSPNDFSDYERVTR
jgi:hypothetical protein